MTKITYSSLKLKTPSSENRTFTIEGKEIEVKDYVSISDKSDMIDIALQKSIEGKLYNPLKVDMYLHLYMVYFYTNITFTDKQKEDEEKLYDSLYTNGIINKVVELIPETEYNMILKYTDKMMETALTYNTTASAIIDTIVNDLPRNAQAAADMLNGVSTNNFQNIIDFAKTLNGNREI
jgi:hypothetical protein